MLWILPITGLRHSDNSSSWLRKPQQPLVLPPPPPSNLSVHRSWLGPPGTSSSQHTDPLVCPRSSFHHCIPSSYSTHQLLLVDTHCPSHTDVCSHTLHTHFSLSSHCHHGHMDVSPSVPPQLLHSDPKHTHVWSIESTSHRKDLEMEFNDKTGQTALTRHRA